MLHSLASPTPKPSGGCDMVSPDKLQEGVARREYRFVKPTHINGGGFGRAVANFRHFEF